jgi:hypothetical protein
MVFARPALQRDRHEHLGRDDVHSRQARREQLGALLEGGEGAVVYGDTVLQSKYLRAAKAARCISIVQSFSADSSPVSGVGYAAVHCMSAIGAVSPER